MFDRFAIALVLIQSAPSADAPFHHGTAWIVATVGHSEFCPAGNVRLDLITGQYQFTQRAARRICHDARLERPVTSGRLTAERLQTVRTAYQRVLDQGIEKPICRNGGRPDEIIINNGGTPVLVLATGAEAGAAPEDLTCWSDAANALHEVLDQIFDPDSIP